MRSMAAPDFRSDKMSSLEGYGRARARWQAFQDSLPETVWEDIYEARVEAGWIVPGNPPDDGDRDDIPDEAIEEMGRRSLEESELLGFWIAWQVAGGFANLQEAGWHRATIHRKIRRFRARYDQHPDEFTPGWLTLDLEKVWQQKIVEALHPEPVEEPD